MKKKSIKRPKYYGMSVNYNDGETLAKLAHDHGRTIVGEFAVMLRQYVQSQIVEKNDAGK